MRFIVFLLVLLVAFPVYATRNVSGPSVDADALRYEFRNALEFDDRASRDERISQLFFIDYGVNDWLAFRATGRWNKPRAGAAHEFTTMDMDARIEWIEAREAGFSIGSRFAYTHQKKAFAADSISIHTLAETRDSGWLYRGNAVVSRDVGAYSEPGVELQLATEILYDIAPQLSIGGEWFGTLGNLSQQEGYSAQQHQIGPVSQWRLTQDTQLEISYLQGISKAASDSMVQVFVRGKF